MLPFNSRQKLEAALSECALDAQRNCSILLLKIKDGDQRAKRTSELQIVESIFVFD